MADNTPKTRAGTKAQPFPWEEALEAQLGRTKKRLKGLATDPVQEGVNIVRQYLHDPTASPEENERKLDELAMGFVGSTTGKVGNVKVKSTVKDPERMAFPGIYQRPDVIAAEAASRVAEESPNLQKVFGVTREDLFQMGKGRQGNLPGNLPGAAAKPKGSAAAARVMGSKNVQRIIDTMAEAEKHPRLVQGMDPWYVMDPVYQRMEQLLGRDKAIEEYRKLNTLMGMASPGSEVLTEIPRGTAAYYLQKQGRFPEFMEYAGKPAGARGTGFPADILNVPGHAYHKTAQALPMQQFLESGEMQMSSPKVPMYIEASGVPQTGFQTRTPVGDAHWSRAVGLADTRGAATRKGQPIVPGASVTNPEMSLLGPWWREEVAAPMGLESVPAQARAWGTFSGQTGVTTPIGAPKIELLADKIVETAHRLGVSINKARDLVLMGETYAGKKNGGLAMATGGQAFPLQEDFQTEMERRRARPRTRAGVPVEDTNVLGGALQGLGETLVGGGRGALATMLGAPADILNLLNVKQFGTPDIPYGSEFFKESLPLAPTTQTGKTAQQLGEFLPINPEQPVQAGVAGARKAGKALAPTMADMLEAQLQKTGMMMPIAPEGKAAKIKAPANDLGFYNPAEKAALNLQRKKGTGDAFLADLKKQPGVNDERLTELGLDQFKGRPNVTREEIIAATEERRIPLQESVKRERDEARIEQLESEYDDLLDGHSEASVTGDLRAKERFEREMADNLEEQKALKSVEEAMYGPSSHPDYVMPGGTDYREIRIKLPDQSSTHYTAQNKYGATLGPFKTEAEARAAVGVEGSVLRFRKNADEFTHAAHHGNEPNVLLHLRVANHVDADGKKGLLIDELQSDWHQQGAKRGYKPTDTSQMKDLVSQYDALIAKRRQLEKIIATGGDFLPETQEAIKEAGEINRQLYQLSNQMGAIRSGVPDAPFKSNWYQIGLKRAIKEAADTGMDRVYLTTGARQADRYDLSKQVDEVIYSDQGVLHARGKDGETIINQKVPQDKLADYIGKEAAEKLIKTKEDVVGSKVLSGVDLKVGGEGMKQWYDKTYKNYLEKYAKQHGGKLGVTHLKTKEDWPFPIQISSDGEKYWISGRDPRIDANNPNLAGKKFDSWDEANKAREAFYSGHDEPVYYIDITDAMRESAKKGQSYKDGGAVHPAVEKFAASLPHPAVTEFVAKLADGGGVWKAMVDGKYNTVPDTSDAEKIIQGPAFAKGGGVWEQLVKGAGNA